MGLLQPRRPFRLKGCFRRPTMGINALSQSPLHATFFMSTRAHSPGPSLIPLPGLGCPLGTTGHQHCSKLLLQYQYENPWGERTGHGKHLRDPRMDYQILWTATWIKFRGLVFKAEPTWLNPYTLPPPTNKGPRNPKGCNICAHH